jgi:hypothetical protein
LSAIASAHSIPASPWDLRDNRDMSAFDRDHAVGPVNFPERDQDIHRNLRGFAELASCMRFSSSVKYIFTAPLSL